MRRLRNTTRMGRVIGTVYPSGATARVSVLSRTTLRMGASPTRTCGTESSSIWDSLRQVESLEMFTIKSSIKRLIQNFIIRSRWNRKFDSNKPCAIWIRIRILKLDELRIDKDKWWLVTLRNIVCENVWTYLQSTLDRISNEQTREITRARCRLWSSDYRHSWATSRLAIAMAKERASPKAARGNAMRRGSRSPTSRMHRAALRQCQPKTIPRQLLNALV